MNVGWQDILLGIALMHLNPITLALWAAALILVVVKRFVPEIAWSWPIGLIVAAEAVVIGIAFWFGGYR